MQYAEKHSQDPLAAGLDTIRIEQGEMMPLFYVDDPTAVPLAWYDKNPDLTAAAVKRHKNWTAVYSGPGTFSPEFPRALAAEAGIRPVGPLNDVTVAQETALSLFMRLCRGARRSILPKKST